MLPKIYKPKTLRETKLERRDKRMYGIGIEHEPGEFGMLSGPSEKIRPMLETIGEKGHRILRFNRDGTDEVLYRWSVRHDSWVKSS
jgi:alpha-ketoglutarate-dependent taurine dioxygenase